MNSEQIRQKINELRPQLNDSDPKQILEQMRELDKQLTAAKRAELLQRVNAEQTRKRELAAKVWACEEPTEDITTNDGSFHKVKVKKYPKLAALSYVHASFKDGKLTQINYNGEKFRMYKIQGNYNAPDIYTRPDSFADFLELNGVMREPLTPEQFTDICDKLKEAKEELQEHIKQYQQKLAALNYSALAYYKLIGQHAEHVYTYTPNC